MAWSSGAKAYSLCSMIPTITKRWFLPVPEVTGRSGGMHYNCLLRALRPMTRPTSKWWGMLAANQ